MLTLLEVDLASAMLLASARGGGIVEIPAGRMELTAPLSLQPNVWLRGQGPSSIIAAAPGFAYPALIDTGTGSAGVIGVSDLTIDCGAITETSSGIGLYLQRVEPGSFVERVIIRRSMRSGIVIGSVAGVSVGVRVQGCTFIQCGRLFSQFGRTDPDFMGLGIVNAIDVIVSGNIFQDCPIAIDAEQHPNVPDFLTNLLIHGNVIRTSVGYPTCWGISVLGQPDRPAKHVCISGNVLMGGPGLTGQPIAHECVESFAVLGNHVQQG